MSKVVVKENQPAGPQEVCEAGSRRRVWGLMVTAGVSGTLVALYAVVTPFVTPALRRVCLPFVPATSTQIQNVLKMLENRSGSLVDIGSGDGRIVIAAAKRGFKAVGYELNPWLVWYSRYRAWRDGVHQNTKFYISDLWKVSFSRYTNVVVFGVPQMRSELCLCVGRAAARAAESHGSACVQQARRTWMLTQGSFHMGFCLFWKDQVLLIAVFWYFLKQTG
ncbi:ATP synthase subunit C lysine N-methyltransferase isoform X2 [Chroicocephalus ridibundus]|uniref:ATP synthase subunit C lysine N-methyltransferase isoform X2 n=1 Tax=Chroicocephalus ridibundus TaxID=1192867 RepID=UPI002FDD6BBD